MRQLDYVMVMRYVKGRLCEMRLWEKEKLKMKLMSIVL